jgi:hypothetical protein
VIWNISNLETSLELKGVSKRYWPCKRWEIPKHSLAGLKGACSNRQSIRWPGEMGRSRKAPLSCHTATKSHGILFIRRQEWPPATFFLEGGSSAACLLGVKSPCARIVPAECSGMPTISISRGTSSVQLLWRSSVGPSSCIGLVATKIKDRSTRFLAPKYLGFDKCNNAEGLPHESRSIVVSNFRDA